MKKVKSHLSYEISNHHLDKFPTVRVFDFLDLQESILSVFYSVYFT